MSEVGSLVGLRVGFLVAPCAKGARVVGTSVRTAVGLAVTPDDGGEFVIGGTVGLLVSPKFDGAEVTGPAVEKDIGDFVPSPKVVFQSKGG